MKGDVASAAASINLITGVVIALAATFIIVVWLFPQTRVYWVMPIVAAMLGIIVVWAFLRAPVGYELSGDTLTVKLRIGSERFNKVSSCNPVAEPVSLAVRTWGNGGLFAVTGRYRNKEYGSFRAYVTDPKRLVLVETAAGEKIVISPANAEAWVCAPGERGRDGLGDRPR